MYCKFRNHVSHDLHFVNFLFSEIENLQNEGHEKFSDFLYLRASISADKELINNKLLNIREN